MILCKVCGTIRTKNLPAALEGLEFALLLHPDGSSFAAANPLRAGVGSRVMVCQGKSAQALFGTQAPIDAAIVGVISPSAPE